jgi:hypothetical protein
MGAVLTAVAKPWGLGGLAALRYGLALATLAVCMWCARRRGASLAIICPLLIPGLFFSRVAFSPVRAQAVTLFMLACLLFFLDADRRGRRAWALPWLVLYVVWLNVHGGFAAGLILFAAHAVEQTVRRAPSLHLWGLLAAMVALIAVNPYGAHYYSYLWTGLLMDRPLVEEWASLWHSRADIIAIYVLSLGVLAYVCWRLGPRQPVAKVLCCRKRGISGQVEAAKRGESVVDSVSFANKELARKARSPARMTFATGCSPGPLDGAAQKRTSDEPAGCGGRRHRRRCTPAARLNGRPLKPIVAQARFDFGKTPEEAASCIADCAGPP